MMKKITALLTALAISCSFTAAIYADVPINAEESTTINENGVTRFNNGIKDVTVRNIILTETGAGNFKKDKTIYLKANHLKFEDGITAEVTKGDLKIKDIKRKDDVLKITIDKASTEESEITLSNIKLFLDGTLGDGFYGLELITESSNDYPNNMFGGAYGDSKEQAKFSTASVTLMDDFVEISTPMPKAQINTAFNEKVSVSLNNDVMQVGNATILMEQKAYLTDDGHVMLPLRAIIEALSNKAIVNWDDSMKRITISLGSRIFSMQMGSDELVINGVPTKLDGRLEMKEGRLFLPMRDLAYALSIPDSKIHWDSETMTVTLNGTAE